MKRLLSIQDLTKSMEGSKGRSGRPITQQIDGITPTIRIVHIIAPKIIKTDQANFRALVQKLTGNHSHRSSKKQKRKKKILKSDNCQAPIDDDHHILSNQEGQTGFGCYQDKFPAPLAQIKPEYLEEDSVSSSGSFSEIYDGFGEMDFFTALLGSGSMLPEFPTINIPPVNHTDSYSGIFRLHEGCGGWI